MAFPCSQRMLNACRAPELHIFPIALYSGRRDSGLFPGAVWLWSTTESADSPKLVLFSRAF